MITQLLNSNGNAVKNQFVSITKTSKVFQSYDTIIASIDNKTNSVTLDPKWCFSATTLKHLKIFLDINTSKAQMLKDIENGVYKIKNLN